MNQTAEALHELQLYFIKHLCTERGGSGFCLLSLELELFQEGIPLRPVWTGRMITATEGSLNTHRHESVKEIYPLFINGQTTDISHDHFSGFRF